jgi:mevalonate kinase
MAHAFGKVLLFGEHAVVHGIPAIAAGLPLRVTAHVQPAAHWRLCAPAWDLTTDAQSPTRVLTALQALAEALGVPGAWSVDLDAQVPAGAGLGSSAAMAVAVARALADAVNLPISESRLFDAAMASERVFHGNPSGLDHMAAIRGGIFRFVRGTPPQVTPIQVAVPLSIVVAQVARGGDTGVLVAGVAERLRAAPVEGQAMLQGIATIVDRALAALQAGDLATLGRLMTENHAILKHLGVSTPELDVAVHTALAAGALGAKLTGAGGGGCMIALVESASVDAVQKALSPLSLRTWSLVLPST